MMKKNEDNQSQNLNGEREKQLGTRCVRMFFSFDIVNSTAYKTLNATGWSQVTIALFNKLQQLVTEKIPGAELWKLLGDEILFTMPVRGKENIFACTSSIFEILNSVIFQIKKGEFFDELKANDIEKDLMKMQNIISLKAAAWLAITGKVERLEKYDNLMEVFTLREGQEICDFLGSDIDTGFRMKENIQVRRFVISYDLAHILAENKVYLKNLHIITYKKLKGIWQDRLYPVIWYHDENELDGMSFEDSFYYDEKETCELVKLYYKNREEPVLEEKMYSDVAYAFNKIMEDQRLEDKFIKMKKIIKESQ